MVELDLLQNYFSYYSIRSAFCAMHKQGLPLGGKVGQYHVEPHATLNVGGITFFFMMTESGTSNNIIILGICNTVYISSITTLTKYQASTKWRRLGWKILQKAKPALRQEPAE